MKKELEMRVLNVLQNKPETRGDDYLLVLEVLKFYANEKMSLESIMINHKTLGLPSLESITRCRRRLQEEDPSLSSQKIKEFRKKETKQVLEYLQERGC